MIQEGVRFFMAAAVSVGFAGAAPAYGPVASDSGIEGPPYSEIVAELEALENRYGNWVDVDQYGRTPGGRPLKAITIAHPTAQPQTGISRPAVMISGATHGNEYLHIADRLPQWFLENRDGKAGVMKYFASGGVIYIVPVLNPDGYDRDRRRNRNGVDLNRDFDLIPENEDNFEEPETRFLADYLDRQLTEDNAELALAVDYHCCDGSLLYPWSYTMDPLPPEILDGHQEIAQLMLEFIDPHYDHGSTGQVLGYTPEGTSKDYYYAKYGALAFTFEGRYGREDDNFPGHTRWWDHILSRVAPDVAE